MKRSSSATGTSLRLPTLIVRSSPELMTRYTVGREMQSASQAAAIDTTRRLSLDELGTVSLRPAPIESGFLAASRSIREPGDVRALSIRSRPYHADTHPSRPLGRMALWKYLKSGRSATTKTLRES